MTLRNFIQLLPVALALCLSASAAAQTQRPQASSTASIEGTLVRLGTNEPVSGADIELTRLEGSSTAPLAPQAAEAYAMLQANPNAVGAAPPAGLSSEVQFTRSGENGRFRFTSLKPGGYRLVAVMVGGDYYPAEYGQRDPRGRGLIFPVAEGEAKQDLKLEMAATGVISGQVRDEDGQPMGHVSVLAIQYVYEDGHRQLRIMRGVVSDERGNYRLFWLPPGQYFVAARVEDPKRRATTVYIGQPGRYRGTVSAEAPVVTTKILPDGTTFEESYRLLYFGGVLDPEKAKPIDLSPGGSVAGVDLFLGPAKIRAHHVRGTLVNAGQPAASVEVRVIPLQPSPSAVVSAGTTDSKGAFDLGGVVAGRHALFTSFPTVVQVTAAGSQPQPSPGAFALIEVVDHDIDISLSAVLPLNVEGHLTVERSAGAKDLDLAKVRINLTRDPYLFGMPVQAFSGGTAQDLTRNAGAFTVKTLPGDFRVVVSGLPQEAYVKSIRLGSEDILRDGLHVRDSSPANPLEIVIATDASEMTGIAVDDRRQPMPNATVLLVPDSQGLLAADTGVSTRTDAMGRFTIPGIRPGDYKLFAWEYVDPGVWEAAGFLSPYQAFAKSIRIAGNSKQEVQVSVAPRR
jgi:hypothetical protein